MKKILIIFFFLSSACPLWAQQPAFDRLYEKYAGREGFMSVEMGRKMMEMMARHVTKSDRDLASLIGGIRSIRVLKAQQPRSEEAVQFSRELLSMAADGEYALVMSRTEDGQTSEFYFIDGGNSAPSEFLMICFGPEERMALDIYGVFDVKDISRLSTLRGQ